MPEPIARVNYGAHQFAAHLGLTRWQLRVGLEHEILPGPDLAGERWSAGPRRPGPRTRRGGPHEIRYRAAGRFRTGRGQAGRPGGPRRGAPGHRGPGGSGDLDVISSFRGFPVYLLRDLDRLDPDSVRQVVRARKGPLTDTVDAAGAVMILGWPRRIFDRIAIERDLAIDRLSRYTLADIHALQADEILAHRVAEEKRHLTLARTRRSETHIEDVIRAWVLRCSAYVDHEADQPPDLAPLTRAIRSLTRIRSELASQEDATA